MNTETEAPPATNPPMDGVLKTDYEIRLRSSEGWAQLDIKGIWQYRDLLLLLVWRDFSVKFKQTILGPLWLILQPLLPTLVFTVVFGKVAMLPTDNLPPLLFYLINQMAWACFALNFNATANTFSANLGLFSKVYFPRLVVPLASLCSNAFGLAIQLVSFFIFYIYYKYWTPDGAHLSIPWTIVLLPFIGGYMALLALGFGLWMSAITAKYRDLANIMPVLVQVWMFGTPVVIPLSKFPAHWLWLVTLNPVSFPVEAFRYCLVGKGTLVPEHAIMSACITLLVLWSGLRLFGKVERTFVDVA